jgi:hypothetical protein
MLTEQQKARLAELVAKKKADKTGKGLSPKEYSEFKELMKLSKAKDPKPGNPFSAYTKYPELTKDAGVIAMNYLPGTRFAVDRSIIISGAIGVTVFNTYGIEHETDKGLNVAVRDIWLKMHRKYRGLNAYQQADVGMVLVSAVELYCLGAEIERIYGVINHYNILNRNVPDSLLAAMGVSGALAASIRANLSDFRLGFNILMNRLQNVFLPNDLSILTEKIALYGFVYADSDSKYQQSIVFTSKTYGMYAPAALKTGGAVEFIVDTAYNWCSGMTNYKDILTYLGLRITALVDDDDVQKIFSDMLAAFSKDQLCQMRSIEENWVVNPIKNESILHKFHNMEWLESAETDEDPNLELKSKVYTTIGGQADSTLWDDDLSMNKFKADGAYYIYQLGNVICTGFSVCSRNHPVVYADFETDEGHCAGHFTADVASPRDISASATKYEGESVLDVLKDNVEQADVFEGCLWKPAFAYRKGMNSSKPMHYLDATSCCTELMCQVHSFSKTAASSGVVDQLQHYEDAGTGITIGEIGFQNCDWARPIEQISWDSASSYCYINATLAGEVQNARLVRRPDFYRIHEVALLSLWKTDIHVLGE